MAPPTAAPTAATPRGSAPAASPAGSAQTATPRDQAGAATALGKSTTVGPLLTYIKYYVSKSTHMEAALQHAALTAILLLSLFIGTLPESAAGLAYAAAQRRMLTTSFLGVTTSSGWPNWLSSVVSTHYDLATLDSGSGLASSSPRIASDEALLYGFVVELYRSVQVDCDDTQDDGAIAYLRAVDPRRYPPDGPSPKCFPQAFTPSNALRNAKTPLSPGLTNARWLANSTSVRLETEPAWSPSLGFSIAANGTTFARGPRTSYCSALITQGAFAGYNCEDSSTMLFIEAAMLNTTAGRDAALRGIAELQAGSWVTNVDVRAVAVTGLYFHRASSLLLRVGALLEVGSAGAVQTTIEAWSSHVLSIGRGWTPTNAGIFSLDILVLLNGVAAIWFVLYRFGLLLQLNSRVGNALDFHLLLDFAIIVLIGVYCGMRFTLWSMFSDGAMFPPSASVSRADALGTVLRACGLDRTTRQIGAWLMLVTVFRTMYSARYVSRLGLVFETIAASATQFVSMAIPFMTILLAYGCAGTVLWFDVSPAFGSIGRAVLTLFNFAVSLDTGSYYGTLTTDGTTIPLVYFVTFFLVSWGVLMNVLISILATAFASAMNTQVVVRRPEWTIRALMRDSWSLWSRRTEDRSGREHPLLHSPCRSDVDVLTLDVASSAGLGHFAVRTEPKWNVLLKISLFGMLPRANTARAALLLEELRLVKKQHGNDFQLPMEDVCRLSLFDPAVTARMITKAELHVGVSDAGRRRWLIMQKFLRMERDVSAQLSIQFRQLQELAEALCGAELGAEVEASESDAEDDDDAAANLAALVPSLPNNGASMRSDDADDDNDSAVRSPVSTAATVGGTNDNGGGGGAFAHRVATQTTLREVQSLVLSVNSAIAAAQGRHAALLSAVELAQLVALAADVEQLALSIGVVV